LEAFWREGYFPRDAALVVAGDLNAGELHDLAEKHFGSWVGTGEAPGQPPDAGAPARRVVVVDRPELPQTVLRIGHVGVPRSHPDFIPVDVMNTALGGLFSSRINLNLREVHGYTYGASSAFAFRRGAGPFIVATSVRADATAAAVMEILREIERMRTGELAAAELVAARESITRSLPGRFETTSQAASSIGKLFVHNLPLDYYRTLPACVDAVTAADAQRVARQFLKPDGLVVVAVGDRGRILGDLEALGLGPIEQADPDGEPLTTGSNRC
jgi:zinc protease